MTRIMPPEDIILNLKQHLGPQHPWYMTTKQAYRRAVRYSGVDFGDNVDAWEEWFTKSPEIVGKVYSTATLKTQCELLIKNLRKELSPENRKEYVAPEHALVLLIEKTGQDFGDDADAWEDWVIANLSEDAE